MKRQKIKVIGVGNAFRRDDGAGIEAARRLTELLPGEADITTASGEGADLMMLWEGSDHVIVIDASSSGAAPGTIHRLDASETPIPSSFFKYSSHAFGVAEAVELARVLGRLPERLILYGIEGRDFEAGETLTDEVKAAVDEVVGHVTREPSWSLL